jgi:hypothetical protein
MIAAMSPGFQLAAGRAHVPGKVPGTRPILPLNLKGTICEFLY